jgi:hypothetical protein
MILVALADICRFGASIRGLVGCRRLRVSQIVGGGAGWDDPRAELDGVSATANDRMVVSQVPLHGPLRR